MTRGVIPWDMKRDNWSLVPHGDVVASDFDVWMQLPRQIPVPSMRACLQRLLNDAKGHVKSGWLLDNFVPPALQYWYLEALKHLENQQWCLAMCIAYAGNLLRNWSFLFFVENEPFQPLPTVIRMD